MQNDLSYRNELLICLAEECGEVVQACAKIMRFNNDPRELEKELGDVLALIELAHRADIISYSNLDNRIPVKLEKLSRYSNLIGANELNSPMETSASESVNN